MKRFYSLIAVIAMYLQVSAVDYCASSAWGYGAGVTGGGNAAPTLVSTYEGLKSALVGTDPKVVIITQDIEFTHRVSVDVSNLTLMALPGKKLYSNKRDKDDSGILIFKGSSTNIILRNLTFEGPGAFDCDGYDNLSIEGATNVWVDHCDFQDGMDGNFDIKNNTDNITVTWCRFRYFKAPKARDCDMSEVECQKKTDDHRFTNLIGSEISNKPTDGWFNITYGYCWWDEGCKQRMTRCRNSELHFLNCYWNSSVADYYVGPENAKCYFEGCAFEGSGIVWQPFNEYYYDSYCKFVNSTGNLPSNSGSVSAPTYSYDELSAADAKEYVTNSTCGAGATLNVTTEGAVSAKCVAPVYYTVTWDATSNGGTCATATTKVESGKTVGKLPSASRAGYDFKGWFTEKSGGTKVSGSGTPITCDVTFYAQFVEKQSTDDHGITWNFSTSDFNSLDTIKSTMTINGLTIYATASKYQTPAYGEKTIDGITFTHMIKTGGTGASDARHFSFEVSGACTIEVYMVSANSTDSRTLNIYSGAYGGTLLTAMTAATIAAKRTYDYTGNATTIRMGSANGGINIYAINVIYHSSNKSWLFSDDQFTSLSSTDIEAGLTIDGLTLGPLMVLDGSNRTIEGVCFTHRLKTTKKGTATSYYLSFDVTGACTIEVYLVSAKSSEDRHLDIFSGNYGGNWLASLLAKTDGSKQSYQYTGGATTLFMGGNENGVNIYAINVIYDDATAVYKVNHYQQNITDDDYTFVEAEYPSGVVSTQTQAASKEYTGFNANKICQELIAADGSTVIDIYYNRQVFTVTFVADGTMVQSEQLRYGAMPSCANPTKAEDEQYTYSFKEWTPEIVAVTGDATYTAVFTATAKTPTGVVEVQSDNVQCTKVLRDGQLYLMYKGTMYDVLGNKIDN